VEGDSLILAELLLIVAVVLGFGAQQLWSLRSASRKAALEKAKAAARTAHEDQPKSQEAASQARSGEGGPRPPAA
jgi:hypothetical protein